MNYPCGTYEGDPYAPWNEVEPPECPTCEGFIDTAPDPEEGYEEHCTKCRTCDFCGTVVSYRDDMVIYIGDTAPCGPLCDDCAP